jgi:hypothetical protein
VVRRLERRQFGTAWTVTEPALHVVTCTAAYCALMLHLPWVAADAHAGLGQLAKLYAYNVLTLFAPPKALKALCAPPNHLRAGGAGRSEASTGGSSRSTGMGSRSHKRSGANHKEGGSDGSGSDPEPSTGAAASSTTNKATGPAVSTPAEQLLSADARAFADLKRFAMLAAEEFAAPGTATSGGGATGASGKGNGGSGLRIYRNSTASNSAADSRPLEVVAVVGSRQDPWCRDRWWSTQLRWCLSRTKGGGAARTTCGVCANGLPQLSRWSSSSRCVACTCLE